MLLEQFKKHYREALRFIVVGVVATGVHYGIYYLLIQWINVNIAYTAGYAVSLVLNFYLSNFFTFNTTPTVGKSVKFLLCHGVNYLLHMALLNLFLYLSVPREIAPLFVLAIAIPVNFVLVRLALKGRTPKGGCPAE